MAFSMSAQLTPSRNVRFNNVNALVSGLGTFSRWTNGGDAFNEDAFEGSRYCVPATGTASTIFCQSLWIAGINDDDTLCCAALRYGSVGDDFWPGPLRTTDGSTDIKAVIDYHHVWLVTRAEIEDFIANGGKSDYTIPESILTWPGNGNVDDGYAKDLAPYIDVNNDGWYRPEDGDYPDIKGDVATFFVFNDNYSAHLETGGHPIKLEVQGMAYAFDNAEDEILNNTVFLHYKLMNRSDSDLRDAYIGLWTDFDIGYGGDDYVGCDVERGYYFGYNGFLYDDEYLDHVPAQMIMFLGGPSLEPNGADDPKHDENGQQLCNESINGLNFENGIVDDERLGMTGFVTFNNYNFNSYSNNADPETAPEYYNYLHGCWKDGERILYGTSIISDNDAVGPECVFMFPGDSDPLNWGTGGITPNGGYNQNGLYWTENEFQLPPDDRQGLGLSGPFVLKKDAVQELDFALVTCFGPTPDEPELRDQYADHVRDFFIHNPNHRPKDQTSPRGQNPYAINPTGFTHGSGSEDDPYLIENAEQFTWLANVVNKDYAHETEGKFYTLTTDIDLNGSEDNPWCPIGAGSGRNIHGLLAFRGTLDGGYHRITNLYINDSLSRWNQEYSALFEDCTGTIRNLYVGGYVNDPNHPVAGIVGRQVSNTIEGCVSEVKLNTTVEAGGIVAMNERGSISECCNLGDIHSSIGFAGGIVGRSRNGTVENCYNVAEVSADDINTAHPLGIVAGICGGAMNTTLKNCYNVGTVRWIDGLPNAGGLVGTKSAGNIENSYYLETCGDNQGLYGVSKTAEEMRSEAFVTALNLDTDVWVMDVDLINDGYPILRGSYGVTSTDEMPVTIYPNPVSDQANILCEGMTSITVISILGQQVDNLRFDNPVNQAILELSHYPQGIYLVRITTAQGIAVGRILVND